MALIKINKNFSPKTKEIRYLNKDFSEYRQNLIDFAKIYFPDTYSDFNDASPGMMFIEMASYVGDVLSFYIDSQFKENLIQYAEEQNNIISIAQSLGYKIKPGASASTSIEVFQIAPALSAQDDFQPDENFYLKISSGMVVSSTEFGTVNFRTLEDVNFADATDREVIVYTVDGNNQPLTYLIKKRVRIASGDVKTSTVTIGNPEKFKRIPLHEQNILEIVKVTDSNGNIWSQVDYLAQDLIFEDKGNANPASASDQGIAPECLINIKTTPRRFITRYNSDFTLDLQFGSGVLSDSDELVFLDSKKIASSEYQSRLSSTTLDPSDFLSSTSYGLAPSNTTLTIQYVVGGGIESNVPSGTINKIVTKEIKTDRNSFTGDDVSLFDNIVSTLAVNNPEPAGGGRGADSVEEIRQNSMAFFNAQNRVVSAKDYVVRTYAMPPKYGAVSKAFVVQDQQINNVLQNRVDPADGKYVVDAVNSNTINLYVLGFDKDKKLIRLNDQTKKNLKSYLETYRMLTDQVNILDGFVVNIGVNFGIVTYKNQNLNEVLTRCIDAIREFFNIERWQLNQPIIVNDVYSTILQVDGVQNVTSLEIVNKYAFKDGGDYENFVYDIKAATDVNGIIYPSIDPAIFELRYPNVDIVGKALQ